MGVSKVTHASGRFLSRPSRHSLSRSSRPVSSWLGGSPLGLTDPWLEFAPPSPRPFRRRPSSPRTGLGTPFPFLSFRSFVKGKPTRPLLPSRPLLWVPSPQTRGGVCRSVVPVSGSGSRAVRPAGSHLSGSPFLRDALLPRLLSQENCLYLQLGGSSDSNLLQVLYVWAPCGRCWGRSTLRDTRV